MSQETPSTLVTSIADIPGWFTWTDQQVFRYLLRDAAPPEPGHVVELGVYLGKSAALIGEFIRPGERFVVCDLFGASSDQANVHENQWSYKALTQQQFEHNYRSLRGDLPEVVTAASSTITAYLPAGSVRFLHVDASHLYEHVKEDVASAVTLLRDDGIVVFDDMRSPHTPGVPAAVWGAVERGLLRPLLLTPSKLYAVRGDPAPYVAGLRDWLARFGRLQWEVQEVAGTTLLRVWPPTTPPAAPVDGAIREVRELLATGLGELRDGLAELRGDVGDLRKHVGRVERLAQRRPLPERALRRAWRAVRRPA